MDRLLRGALTGSVAGSGATLVMSALMLASRRAGLTSRLPPDKIAEEAIEAVTHRPSTEDEERVVASVTHLAFGAAGGAIYGAMTSGLDLPLPVAAATGTAFGTAVWLVSYEGWIPKLGILPPASRDDPGRVTTMLTAHWLYGACLGIGAAALRRALSD